MPDSSPAPPSPSSPSPPASPVSGPSPPSSPVSEDDDFDSEPAVFAAAEAVAATAERVRAEAAEAAALAAAARSPGAKVGKGRKGIPRPGSAALRVAFVFRSVEGGTDIDKGEKDVLLQNLGSGVEWSTRTSGKFRKKANENRSVFACGFVNEAECPYCVEVLENKTTHRWTVKIGTRPHSDHTRVKRMYVQSENGKPKLSKFAKSLVTEKHVTGTGSTADMIADVHQSGVALDEQGQKMLVMYRQNELRKRKKTAGVKEADRPTLATFHNSWNQYTKEAIAKRTAREAGEDEEGASWALLGEGGDEEEIAGGDHTAFLAGWKQWSGADSSGKIVTKWCYVASSNNLLRNAYRA